MQASAILYATAKIGNYFSTLGLAYTGEHPKLMVQACLAKLLWSVLTEAKLAH